jgi:hypothetical protein
MSTERAHATARAHVEATIDDTLPQDRGAW